MSLILEALKKAEQERARRQASEGDSPSETPPTSLQPGRARPRMAAALLLLATAGAASWWWGHTGGPLPTPAPSVEPSRPTAIVSRETTPPTAPHPAVRPPRLLEGRPAPSAKAAGPAPPEKSEATPAAAPAATPHTPTPPAPSPVQAAVLPPPAPAASAEIPPAEAKPPAGGAPTGMAAVVSTLALNALIYSDVKAERIVYIDGRRYTEGQRVNGVYLLEEIKPEGAVLSYQGERELLPMRGASPPRP